MSMRKSNVLLVLGNGARTIKPAPFADVIIGFNQAWNDVGPSIVAMASTGQDPVTGTHCLRFQTSTKNISPWLSALRVTAQGQLTHQMEQLGCLPSTGFMVVHALWDIHPQVCIDGMNFNPTLARAPELHKRKPLPQMFHNWLGERRVSLSRWMHSSPKGWHWPLTSMAAEQRCIPQEQVGTIEYAEILSELLVAQQSGSLARLKQMLEFSLEPNVSLLQETPDTLRLEQCFHLHRYQSETPNWWLYDNEASEVINRLNRPGN